MKSLEDIQDILRQHSYSNATGVCICGGQGEVGFSVHRAHMLLPLLERAWENGKDSASQYCEQPWVVDDELTNPFRSML